MTLVDSTEDLHWSPRLHCIPLHWVKLNDHGFHPSCSKTSLHNFIFNSFLQGTEFCINSVCAFVYTEHPRGVLCTVITIIIVLNLLLPVSQEIRNECLSVTRKFLPGMRLGHVYINITLTFNLLNWFFLLHILCARYNSFFTWPGYMYIMFLCMRCTLFWISIIAKMTSLEKYY